MIATLIAGCSSDPVDAAPSAVLTPPATASREPLGEVTPSPRATPSPAPLTLDQAARRYLRIVRPYNVALERLEQAINGGRPLTVLRRQAGQVATTNRTQIRQLAGTPWPRAVRGPVRQLQAESQKAQRHWVLAMRASARDALIQEVLNAARYDGKPAVGKIRRLLHLEQYDEEDYS
ncbi:hypothetical protein FH608_049395 [Nonomuraea phyllanthi]|uniref:Uncharacterized protein n=1 Tax=Nonomuraea phyllanthi TaxID=2219224 RepID=A0A5C4UWS2_9ACTN|nr:hypothetical protein [Nonomuraea phyllanthi]KAB8183273.1 hypothetical protein FH608_049395 [Nonomuraea phyllanthi]QFY12997.1 hypothetical protein GBF35_46340 [Nonomuraea phyllanthi]